MTKKCTKCLVEKPITEFYKKGNGYRYDCISCLKEYNKKHYERNKQKYLDSKLRHEQKIRKLIIESKDIPCADCDVCYPYWVMQFDHLDNKDFTISGWKKSGKGFLQIKDEISKCQVVCANCHADRTYKRQFNIS